MATFQSPAWARRDVIAADIRSPAYQAYQILHWGFVAAPVIAGLDKFAGVLTSASTTAATRPPMKRRKATHVPRSRWSWLS